MIVLVARILSAFVSRETVSRVFLAYHEILGYYPITFIYPLPSKHPEECARCDVGMFRSGNLSPLEYVKLIRSLADDFEKNPHWGKQ